jgi:ketosteroid isomerase-like protein
MSQEDLEIVRRAMDAWNRQDVDGLLALTDPGVEFVNTPNAVEPGTRPGREELAAVLRMQWESLPGGRQEIDRLHVRGDDIISVGSISREMPGSDSRIGNPVLLSWKVREKKVLRIEVLAGGSEFHKALEALGLSEQD